MVGRHTLGKMGLYLTARSEAFLYSPFDHEKYPCICGLCGGDGSDGMYGCMCMCIFTLRLGNILN